MTTSPVKINGYEYAAVNVEIAGGPVTLGKFTTIDYSVTPLPYAGELVISKREWVRFAFAYLGGPRYWLRRREWYERRKKRRWRISHGGRARKAYERELARIYGVRPRDVRITDRSNKHPVAYVDADVDICWRIR